MLEFSEMQSSPLLPSPDRVLSIDQIEPFDIQTECKQMTYVKYNCLII